MKKFITTKENPTFKEGIILDYDELNYELSTISNGGLFKCSSFDIKLWVEKGWLKEVEKKKFTKSDMIDWYNYVDYHSIGTPVLEDLFIDYLKQRK